MSDSNALLPVVAAGNGAIPDINSLFNAGSPSSAYGLHPSQPGGLNVTFIGTRWGGTAIADTTLLMTASSTNYVVANRSTGALSTSTSNTNWNNTTVYNRVALVTTNGTGVVPTTGFQDHRAGPNGSNYGPSAGAGLGDVTGPGVAVDNTIVRFDGTTGKTVQASGVVVSDLDEISGYKGKIRVATGTTDTLLAADSGGIVEYSNGSAVAVTAPNSFPVGFNCTIVQKGAGQVTVASTGSGTVVNRQTQFKTAGQYAMAALYVSTNSGTNAQWVMAGDTGA